MSSLVNTPFVSRLLIQINECKTKYLHNLPDVIASRIEFLSDRAGKTRVVALADVFTQTAMKPIFNHFTKILKRIPQDVSFDEAAGLAYARSRINRDTKVWSFDLKNATDRLPQQIIIEAVEPILGPELTRL